MLKETLLEAANKEKFTMAIMLEDYEEMLSMQQDNMSRFTANVHLKQEKDLADYTDIIKDRNG